MRYVLASANRHKAEEITGRLPPGIELLLQTDLGVESPVEDGSTFLDNALLKARHAARVSGLPAIADDSGLSVAALGGEPGVRSARYAGMQATDAENLRKLLDAMQGMDDRRACFQCVLVCVQTEDDPRPVIAEGVWRGEIATRPAGSSGFGYDPVFFIPELGKTAAELTADEKNAISHRGIALARLNEQLI